MEVERQMVSSDISARTIELYKRLTDEEKEYLRSKDQIQIRKTDGKEFAVKTAFYNSLRK